MVVVKLIELPLLILLNKYDKIVLMETSTRKNNIQIMGKILCYIIHFFYVIIIPMFILRSGYIDIDIRYKYILIYSLFLLDLYLTNLILPIKRNSFIIILPILFLTTVGLYVNFEDLVPYVFPVTTILFLLAIIIYFIPRKKIMTMIIASATAIAIYSFGVYPKLISQKELIKTNISLRNFKLYHFLSTGKDSINIRVDKPILIDFMFTTCKPCIEKLNYLQAVKHLDASIYVIVNGSIDSFASFQKFYNTYNKDLQGINFVFDPNGRFTKQFNIESYPTEVLIRNKKLIAREKGVPEGALKEYVQIRKQLLIE